MAEALTPIEIFCCYSHEDEAWLRKLENHLSLLQRQGLISLWHDRCITPGTDWATSIDTHLETASVILLLVSADFLASDYCYGVEMKRALERQEAGEARIVPILVRPVDWKDAPFAHLQALPTDAKAIASWRSQDRALADVTAGIRRVIEEVPLLAASAPRTIFPAIWNIPYLRNPFFLGRDAELAQVRDHLQAGQATALSQPQAISGLGGIGKTQLALEYAYRYHQDYQAVLWARAESTEALYSSYVAIASLLRLPVQEREAREQDIIVQAVKTWLQTHHGWLLILDNADELALVPDFLPLVLDGHLLLTTRAAATGRLAHRLEIGTLPPKQGGLFLLRRAALIAPDAKLSQASLQDRKLAPQISQELGGLPLALDQAGAYLEETGIDLVDYWRIYQQHRINMLRERRGLVADHPAPVTTTWSLAFQKVEEKNPAAAELLRLCAYLAPDAIAEEILTQGAPFLGPVLSSVAADALLLNRAIEDLRAYSLVQRDPKVKTLSIHRLVQAVLQDALEETERHSWAERAVFAVNAAFPHADFVNWQQCERLLPHALLVTQYKVITEETERLLYETASCLHHRGHYAEAEPLFQRALQIREEHLGPEHPDVAAMLNNWAKLHKFQGRFEEAEPLFQRALRIWEQHLGPEHPDVAATLNNLAEIYQNQDKFSEAESLSLRALRIYEQYLGLEHPDVVDSLALLARIYLKQEKRAEAELLSRRALQIREEHSGPEHPDVAFVLCFLGDQYLKQGRFTEAEPLFQRALRIWEQPGLRHYLIYPLTGLANLYLEQGRFEEAEPLFQRALDIGNDAGLRFEMAEIMYGLARLHEAQSNSKMARVWYGRALAFYEEVFGAWGSPEAIEIRKHFIALLHKLGQHKKAARLEMGQPEP